jgi:hypothetical protein
LARRGLKIRVGGVFEPKEVLFAFRHVGVTSMPQFRPEL